MLLVSDQVVAYLVRCAEYRMGIHKVIATLSNGQKESGIIVNSTVFLKENEAPLEMNLGWQVFLNEAAKFQKRVIEVQVIPRNPETLRGVRQIALNNEKNRRLANSKLMAANAAFGAKREQLLSESRMHELSAQSAGAEDAPITLTNAGEEFKRFSAFANDRRVTQAKGLLAGTFATTKEDADANIKTGLDAVARYALPNPVPASNVFTIKPPENIDLKRGTSQPAYNQPGGGVEVIFVNGSPDETVTGPAKIPDK